MSFLEELQKLRSQLKELTDGDNVDKMAPISAQIDKVEEEHKSTEKKLDEIKDKFVDIVKNTSFKSEPKNEVVDENKSLDDILNEGLEEIVKNRKDK